MLTTADWLILAVVVISGGLSLFRGFLKEAISLVAWVSAFVITSRFYEALARKLDFISTDEMVRNVGACIILFVATLVVVGLCGSVIRAVVHKVGLSGTDRLLGMVFGVLRGVLIVCVFLVLMQIGFKLHILSFVADAPFYRDSVFIPELMRIVNWFFDYSPSTQVELEQLVGA